MSEWSNRNHFIRRDEGHERLVSKKRLRAIGHALFSHVLKDPIPATSEHYQPPPVQQIIVGSAWGGPAEFTVGTGEGTVDMETVVEAMSDKPWEYTLPTVNPVTGEVAGFEVPDAVPGSTPEYVTMEERRRLALEAQQAADRLAHPNRPDFE